MQANLFYITLPLARNLHPIRLLRHKTGSPSQKFDSLYHGTPITSIVVRASERRTKGCKQLGAYGKFCLLD